MNRVPVITTWLVGVINGITYDNEKRLSNDVKYGTMGLSTVLTGIEMVLEQKSTLPVNIGASMIAAPIVIGTVFCLGGYVGRSINALKY